MEDELLRDLEADPALSQATGLGIDTWPTWNSLMHIDSPAPSLEQRDCEGDGEGGAVTRNATPPSPSTFEPDPDMIEEMSESMDVWDIPEDVWNKPEDRQRLNEDVGVARNASAPVALAWGSPGDALDEWIENEEQERLIRVNANRSRIEELRAEQVVLARNVWVVQEQLLQQHRRVFQLGSTGLLSTLNELQESDHASIDLMKKRLRFLRILEIKQAMIDALSAKAGV